MTKVACGADGSFQPGDTREVDERTGAQLIQANAAVDITPRKIEARPAPESAVAPAPEKAVMPAAKGKRK